MRAGGSVLIVPALALAGLVANGGAARAAEVAIGEVQTTGIDDGLKSRIAQAIHEVFQRDGAASQAEGLAMLRLDGTITKESSSYEYRLAVLNTRDGKTAAEKIGRCAPCTQEEAIAKLRLAAKALKQSVAEQEKQWAMLKAVPPPPQAATTPQPSQPAPPPAPRGVPAVSSSTESRVSPSTDPGAWRAELAVANLVAGAGTAFTGHVLLTHSQDRQSSNSDKWLFGIGIGALAVGEAGLVYTVLDVIMPRLSGPPSRGWFTAGALTNIAQATALGIASYQLIKHDGYGVERDRWLGYVDAGLAVGALVSGFGYLLVAEPKDPPARVFVAPGRVGVAGRF